MKNFNEYSKINEDSAREQAEKLMKELANLAFPSAKKTSSGSLIINKPNDIVATKYAIILELEKNGITSKRAQANILAQILSESGFKLAIESTDWSAEKLYSMYGPNQTKSKVRFKTMADAERVAAMSPQEKAEIVYGKRDGNNKTGDGYKYRGRGFIQLSTKNNYRTYGEKLGINLVDNPDLALNLDVAIKIIPLYFLNKSGGDVSKLEDIDYVTKKVGAATQDEQKRREIADNLYVSLSKEPNSISQFIAKNDYKNLPVAKHNMNLPSDSIEKFDAKKAGLDLKNTTMSNNIVLAPMFSDEFQKNKAYALDQSKVKQYLDKQGNKKAGDSKESEKSAPQYKSFKDYASIDDMANEIHDAQYGFYKS